MPRIHRPELGSLIAGASNEAVEKPLGEGNNVVALLLKAGAVTAPELADLRVLKLVKADAPGRSIPHADGAMRQRMADEIASTAEKLRARSKWLSEIIPRVIALDVGAVLQEPATGLSYDALSAPAKKVADQQIKQAVSEAQHHLPAWSFTHSPENFLFHEDGRIRAWFDHLADTTGGPRPSLEGGVHIAVLQRSFQARARLDQAHRAPSQQKGPPPVDRYQLESGSLQGGTSAAVFPGIDLATHEAVVIKRMHVPHGPALQHALHEIGIMQTLSDTRSRQLCRLRCAGLQQGAPIEQPWLVLDRGGAPISVDKLKLTPRPAAEAVAIMLHALRGLMALHDRGILHRDVHPQNILVEQDEAGKARPETAMLIDYGQGVRLSHDGRWHVPHGGGNPEYLPPEQIRRGEQHLDATADTFQCAGLLAAMIQGSPPFPGQVSAAYFSEEWSTAWLQIHQAGPQLGGITDLKLRAVLEKALSADPKDRYGPEALIDALRPFAPPDLPLPIRDRLHLADGQLVQQVHDPRVMVMCGGAPLWVPNPEALVALNLHHRPIQILPEGSYERMRRTPADGTLVQEHGQHAIYLMSRGRKVWIPNPETFVAMGLDWSAVRKTPPGSLASIPDGSLER